MLMIIAERTNYFAAQWESASNTLDWWGKGRLTQHTNCSCHY